ncbi:hypothetical protein BJ546DRAFT_1023797 [Cryomyces antarcticus]
MPTVGRLFRVGIIGAGEVAQVIHLPTLQLLNHLYKIAIVCDISQQAVDFCKARHRIPEGTTDPYAVINHSSVDVILNLTSDEFHETYTIAALEAGKNVMIEKPLTLSLQSAERIIEAEKKAKNEARVFVGYMRRYAPSFVGAFKREVASIDRILYARSRDIVGPNTYFVGQSGTSAQKFSDLPPNSGTQRTQLLGGLLQEAFPGQEVTDERRDFCRFLGSLGSHDLSLMRELLGFPESACGVSVNEPFYTATFNYRNSDGHAFAVTYESGIDNVPRFDAHLAVYGRNKTVSIQYDTPYIKGLPITVTVDEKNADGEVVQTRYLSSYEDAYTAELKELHACLTEGGTIKTTAEDAREDLRLFRLMFEQWDRQQGVAR